MNKTYKAAVTMTPEEFERINGLLSIDELGEDPELDAKYDAKRDENKLICKAGFENGVLLNLYLYSGTCNYFIDPIFFVKDRGEVGCDEAVFELSKDNEFIFDDDTYLLHIDIADADSVLESIKDLFTLTEKYVSKEYKTTTLYFTGPARTFGGRYPDAFSAEISIEFPTNTPEARYASVMVSPVQDDLNWTDYDMPLEDIEALMAKAGY